MYLRFANHISVIDIYYFYHGFGLKTFEGRHIRMYILSQTILFAYMTVNLI